MKQWYIKHLSLHLFLKDIPWALQYILVDYPTGIEENNHAVRVVNDLGNGLIIGEGFPIWDGKPFLQGVYRDDDGEVIIPFSYTRIDFNPSEGLFYCTRVNDEKIQRIDLKGRIVVNDGNHLFYVSREYDDANDSFSEGLLAVHRFWEKDTPELSEEQFEGMSKEFPYIREFYEECEYESEGFGEWESGWGFIDVNGNEVIPCQKEFFKLGDFHDGLAWVKGCSSLPLTKTEGKSIGYIDKTGRIVIRLSDHYLGDFKNGTAIVGSSSPDKRFSNDLRRINKSGDIV